MNRGSITALCFLLSFALTSCSTISKATKYAPKNELLYPNNADVEVYEKYIDKIGVYIENCAYVIEATYINTRNVADMKLPRSYEIFTVNREIKGTNELFTKEMSMLMLHDVDVHRILIPGNRYLLVVEAMDLSYMPEAEYRAYVFFPLTDNNQIEARNGYIGGAQFNSLDETGAQNKILERFTDLDEKFFTDPINTLLEHPSIHTQIVPVIDHLIPQSYPDVDSMIEVSDVIVVARFPNLGEVTGWNAANYDIELVGAPLLTGSYEGTPKRINLPFTPGRNEEYVLFLREIVYKNHVHYDFISREGACIARQDIPDWEDFISKIK